MIKNLLKTILATGVFLSVLMIPAKSQDIGLAFGVVGSTSTFDTTGEEMEGIGTSPTAFDTNGPLTVSKDVDIGSAFIEVLARGDLGGITLGFEYIPGDAEIGAKSRTDADNGDASGEADTGTYEGKAEISGHKSIYIEPTFYPMERLGIYLKGGVSQVTVDSIESISIGTDDSAYGEEEIYGAMYGIGIRAVLGPGFLIKTEYQKTDYETVELQSTTGNQNKITADPEQEAFRIAIGWQF